MIQIYSASFLLTYLFPLGFAPLYYFLLAWASGVFPVIVRSLNRIKLGKAYGPYLFMEEIGRGGYAVVCRALNIGTRETVIIKAVSTLVMLQEGVKDGQSEVSISKSLNHPSIKRVLDSFRIGVFNCIVYPNDKLLSLYQFCMANDLSLLMLQDLAAQILLLIEYLQSEKIVHLDMKPDNFLIDPTTFQLYLIDFGLSRRVVHPSQRLRITTGSIYYPKHPAQDGLYHIDLYALGKSLAAISMKKYSLATLDRLEFESTVGDLYPHLYDLISSLIDVNEADRLINIGEIKRHRFFSGYDFALLDERLEKWRRDSAKSQPSLVSAGAWKMNRFLKEFAFSYVVYVGLAFIFKLISSLALFDHISVLLPPCFCAAMFILTINF